MLEYKRKLQDQLNRIKEGNQDIQKANGMTQLWKGITFFMFRDEEQDH